MCVYTPLLCSQPMLVLVSQTQSSVWADQRQTVVQSHWLKSAMTTKTTKFNLKLCPKKKKKKRNKSSRLTLNGCLEKTIIKKTRSSKPPKDTNCLVPLWAVSRTSQQTTAASSNTYTILQDVEIENEVKKEGLLYFEPKYCLWGEKEIKKLC